MLYMLARKKRDELMWNPTTKGDLKYILKVLESNLLSSELNEFEWKVQPIPPVSHTLPSED